MGLSVKLFVDGMFPLCQRKSLVTASLGIPLSGIFAVLIWRSDSTNLHIGDKTVPQQLLVRSPKGNNKPTTFLYNISIFDVRLNLPDVEHIERLDGLNVYSLAAALVYYSTNPFLNASVQMRTALSMVTDASDVLSVLLAGNHSVIAGRLVGAFRNIGRDLIANNILKGM